MLKYIVKAPGKLEIPTVYNTLEGLMWALRLYILMKEQNCPAKALSGFYIYQEETRGILVSKEAVQVQVIQQLASCKWLEKNVKSDREILAITTGVHESVWGDFLKGKALEPFERAKLMDSRGHFTERGRYCREMILKQVMREQDTNVDDLYRMLDDPDSDDATAQILIDLGLVRRFDNGLVTSDLGAFAKNVL